MCMVIYIAADIPLPLVPWDEHAPGFHTTVPQEKKGMSVRKHLTKPYVVYAGSHQRCGCGFFVDDDSDCDVPEDSRRLAAYLSEAIRRGSSVELFACWDGEENRAPKRHRVLTPGEIGKGGLEYGETELLTVVPAA